MQFLSKRKAKDMAECDDGHRLENTEFSLRIVFSFSFSATGTGRYGREVSISALYLLIHQTFVVD